MITLTSLLISCEMVVDVDIPEEPPRLVLNAFLQADSVVAVELTESQLILTNTFIPPVGGALVTLSEDGQLIATLEESDRGGIYFSSFTSSIGKTYTLRVSKDGFESVEGTTTIPAPVAIQAVEADTITLENRGFSSNPQTSFALDEVRVILDDPGSERNYYEISAYRYVNSFRGERDTLGNYVVTDTVRAVSPIYLRINNPATSGVVDEFTDSEDSFGRILSFNDDYFNGRTYSLRLNPNVLYSWDSAYTQLYIILRTIDEGRYRYLRFGKFAVWEPRQPVCRAGAGVQQREEWFRHCSRV